MANPTTANPFSLIQAECISLKRKAKVAQPKVPELDYDNSSIMAKRPMD